MRKTTAYARKRRNIDKLAGFRLLDRARPFDEGDTTGEHIKTRACFERLADGTADNNDFYRVAMALNLAKVRALEIDQALADLLEAGQNAMATIRRRHGKWAKWDVLPAERTAIVEALDAHEVITDASSPLQMMAALDVVRRVIRKQARQP
ncbi:hypothetical protein [Acidovorax sp.]|uniref:hypothetical protein n=1 Tax=Acidovorax sp. TaxID=1872122 RepID=UPI0025BBA746|nr:hypothetical protein [Acidovorax sp.]MBW8463845.1 hypothetical protein [Acidovorax sp.]